MPAREEGQIRPTGVNRAEEGTVEGARHTPRGSLLWKPSASPFWVPYMQLVRLCATKHKLKGSPGDLRALF